jgi:hypothetical protein
MVILSATGEKEDEKDLILAKVYEFHPGACE